MAKKLNNNFFKTWTPESAYVIGFFLADGNLSRSYCNTWKFCLTQRDSDILYDIKRVMGSGHKISKRVRNDGTISHSLQISSIELIRPLIELGYDNDKTHKYVKVPDIDKHLQHHMIRGFFDGDGSASMRSIQIDFCRNTGIMEQFMLIFKQHGIPLPKVYPKKLTNGRTVQLDRIMWYVYNHRILVRDWLYNGSTLHLDRKLSIVNDWKEPKYKVRTIKNNDIYGRLTAVMNIGTKWYCECVCGGNKVVSVKNLNAGHVRSCGCLRKRKMVNI